MEKKIIDTLISKLSKQTFDSLNLLYANTLMQKKLNHQVAGIKEESDRGIKEDQ